MGIDEGTTPRRTIRTCVLSGNARAPAGVPPSPSTFHWSRFQAYTDLLTTDNVITMLSPRTYVSASLNASIQRPLHPRMTSEISRRFTSTQGSGGNVFNVRIIANNKGTLRWGTDMEKGACKESTKGSIFSPPSILDHVMSMPSNKSDRAVSPATC